MYQDRYVLPTDMNYNMTIKSVYEQYKYQSIQNQYIFNDILDTFSILITSHIKHVGEFLTIFSPNVDPNPDPVFVRFMDDVSSRLLQSDPVKGVKVLQTILRAIRKLSASKQILLTRFIWDRESFRSMIKFWPRSTNGKLYMNESIFLSVFPDPLELVPNLQLVISAFVPLFTMGYDLLDYIDDIFKKNIGYTYTYDDPGMIDQSAMSTTDMMVLCFIMVTKILKNYKDQQNIPELYLKVFWNGVNVVYITNHIMHLRISDSLRFYIARKTSLTDFQQQQLQLLQGQGQGQGHLQGLQHQLNETNTMIDQGTVMIEYLSRYVSNIDTEYVEKIIFDPHLSFSVNDFLITNYDTTQRLINDIGTTSITTLIERSNTDKDTVTDRLTKLIMNVLSNDVPVHIKFDAMRLLLSHNLKTNMMAYSDGMNIVCRYIINDVARLKYVEHAHLIDILIELYDTPLNQNPEIVELYLYLVPEFLDQYVQRLKMLVNPNTSEDVRSQIVSDLGAFISGVLLLIKYLPSISMNGLSYVGDVLSIIETISNTDSLIKDLIDQDPNAVNPAYDVFADMKKRFIPEFKPFIVQMFKILRHVCSHGVIITIESNRISREVLGLTDEDLSHIKILDPSLIPNDLCDVIKCDIALNPFYISTSTVINTEYHLVDRKTYYGIIRMKQNPFTRETIDRNSLDALNNRDDIKHMRDDIIIRLNRL